MKTEMERRSDKRWPTNLEAQVVHLRNPEKTGGGHITDISASGVCLKAPFQLERGDMVRLEFAGSVLFGHVAYSKPEGPLYRSGIEVVRVLLGGSDMSQLLKSILRDTMPNVPGLEPSEIHIG